MPTSQRLRIAASGGAKSSSALAGSSGLSANPALASGIIGVMILVGSEIMFFGGLVTAFLVLRAGALWWPPPGQPRLPVMVTAFDTLVLLTSGFAMYKGLAAIRRGDSKLLLRCLTIAGSLGAIFLAVQGIEWVRLIDNGLKVTAGLYGALFCTIVGAHGVHVAGGLIALITVMGRAARGRYSAQNHSGVEACWIFWCFVVLLWPVLYVTVYLS